MPAVADSQDDRSRFYETIKELAIDPALADGDVTTFLQRVTEVASHTLGVARASVWFLDDGGDELHLRDLYSRTNSEHQSGVVLHAGDYPNYFHAMRTERSLDVSDARQDPRTRDFCDSYLIPLDIYSMLDASIRIAGRLIGIICLEHTERLRRWNIDENNFAGSLADQISQCLLHRQQLDMIQELQTANENKDRFLDTINHVFRTPMNGIQGCLELLRESTIAADRRQYLQAATECSRQLQAVVDSVLTFTEVAGGKLVPRDEAVDIRTLLADITQPFSAAAHEKGVSLVVDIDDDVPDCLLVDMRIVRLIVHHLLDNALNVTSAGQVRVAIDYSQTSSSTLSIVVSDTGTGIPPSLRARIQRGFSKPHTAGVSKSEGIGLGLALIAHLAAVCDMRIAVTSDVGVGSQFSLQCPVRPAATATACTESIPAPPEREPRVLIVEDNRINRLVAKRFLTAAGYVCASARNGADAVALLERDDAFAIILMDCQMPIMDGFEATRRLRDMDIDIPIVAVTAFSGSSDRQRCLDAGMNDYVKKPIEKQTFLATIAHWTQMLR